MHLRCAPPCWKGNRQGSGPDSKASRFSPSGRESRLPLAWVRVKFAAPTKLWLSFCGVPFGFSLKIKLKTVPALKHTYITYLYQYIHIYIYMNIIHIHTCVSLKVGAISKMAGLLLLPLNKPERGMRHFAQPAERRAASTEVEKEKPCTFSVYVDDKGPFELKRLETVGCGSKLNHQKNAYFSHGFHLPGFHFGYPILTHSHFGPNLSIFRSLVDGPKQKAGDQDQEAPSQDGST